MDLHSPVTKLPLVGPIYAKRLEKLSIGSVNDLLHHVPHRYLDFRLVSKISNVQIGEPVTVGGSVTSIKNQYTRGGKKIQIAEVADNSGTLTAVWFNQPYLIKTLAEGTKVSLAGKVDWFGRKPALVSPEYELRKAGGAGVHTGRLIPIYPETRGISSKWLRGRISFAFARTKEKIDEFLPKETLTKYSLRDFLTAIKGVHFPKSEKEAESARKRLSFNELLMLQFKNIYRKSVWQKNRVVHKLKIDKGLINKFINSLPFKLTHSQEKSIDEILNDLEKDAPMNRLLEGDVGSGKTVVAAAASFVAFANGHQSVFMAPTQILARQHFDTLKKVFAPFNARVTLVTSGGVSGGPGKSDIFVGTHALIHKRVEFENVALVVIDEQQRFGVKQRARLIRQSGKKKKAPHVLTMTATPIPRTVALTVYADLDLSTLDELPKGRQKITTWIVPPQKRQGAYEWISEQIKEHGVQAFIICPLIEESDKETMKQVKAAVSEYERLKKVFKKKSLGLLHGKLKAKEKDEVMDKFKKGKIDILISTPVVEVGIDVANATIMMIEAAERFGLAQLHQLRGRVGRGKKKSYCLFFSEVRSQKVLSRLNALRKDLSGFELAELDLKLRGPGEVFGTHQSGFFDLKIASWQDTQLIKNTKLVAQEAFENPNKFARLLERLNASSIVPN